MLTCCVCGRRGAPPAVTNQSEQRGPGGYGWEPLAACTDFTACYGRLTARLDRETPRTAPPAISAAQGV
jgi:hypothetical protein